MRSAVFDKLNLKDQREIVVLDAPASFEGELKKLTGVTVHRRVELRATVKVVLVFATRLAEVEAAARLLAKAARGDAVVWVAYPKGTSKRHACEFNRDTGWTSLGAAGFEPVRQVAIDEDWSALRFRRAEFIKSMTRSPKHALSAEGRAKAGKPKARPRSASRD